MLSLSNLNTLEQLSIVIQQPLNKLSHQVVSLRPIQHFHLSYLLLQLLLYRLPTLSVNLLLIRISVKSLQVEIRQILLYLGIQVLPLVDPHIVLRVL